MANPLLPKRKAPQRFLQTQGSKGILDDHAIRKSIRTKTLTDNGDGKIGIGTPTPTQPLHLYSATENMGMLFQTAKADGVTTFYFQNDAQIWGLKLNGAASDDFQFVSGASARLTISPAGDVDIISGTLDMNTHKILNVADPTSDQDAATKKYVDDNGGGDLVDDTTPQLGGDLDLNGHAIDFPTTANISDVLDEDDMASNSATKLATQQSIKAYVDTALGADVTVYKATFDITANTSVIAAAGAGIKNKVVAISMHNNDADAADDTVVKITDGNAGTVLIGGATGAVYLVGRGGFFGLPMSAAHPWCETTANTALYINPVSGKRVSGAVWYIQEA